VKTDWDAWNARSLAEEPIVRLILDGTVVRVRLDRKATFVSLLVVLGVREDGQKLYSAAAARLIAFNNAEKGLPSLSKCSAQ
jgi:putative transposase